MTGLSTATTPPALPQHRQRTRLKTQLSALQTSNRPKLDSNASTPLSVEIEALAQDLEAVLRREPDTPHKPAKIDCEFLHDPEPVRPPPLPNQGVEEVEDASAGPINAATTSAQRQGQNPSQPPGLTPWLRQTRRKRWTNAFQTLGAWLLTASIGGFIIASVALLLLGPPKDHATWRALEAWRTPDWSQQASAFPAWLWPRSVEGSLPPPTPTTLAQDDSRAVPQPALALPPSGQDLGPLPDVVPIEKAGQQTAGPQVAPTEPLTLSANIPLPVQGR